MGFFDKFKKKETKIENEPEHFLYSEEALDRYEAFISIILQNPVFSAYGSFSSLPDMVCPLPTQELYSIGSLAIIFNCWIGQ